MGERPLKRSALAKRLRAFGVTENKSRGKGSHTVFEKVFVDGKFTYPLPKRSDVFPTYVAACRRRFRLTVEDGVSDAVFYGDKVRPRRPKKKKK